MKIKVYKVWMDGRIFVEDARRISTKTLAMWDKIGVKYETHEV